MNVEIYLKEIGDVHDHIAGHANEHSGDRDDAFFGLIKLAVQRS